MANGDDDQEDVTTLPVTTIAAPVPAAAAIAMDVVLVASVDHVAEPAATIPSSFQSHCVTGRHNHQNKQRMIRISIVPVFISMLIVATVAHMYKSTATFDKFDTPLSRKVSIEVDELSNFSIEEYVTRTFPTLPNSTNNDKKRIEALKKNLLFAYRNVTVMLDRSHRFPSIQQRVKLYMSNWYIPPCDTNARIAYQYSSTDNRPVLTINELSMPVIVDEYNIKNGMRHNKKLMHHHPPQEQRVFVVDSHFDGTHDTSFDEVHYMDRQFFVHNCTHKYCQDMVEFLLPALDRVQQQQQQQQQQQKEPNNNNRHSDIRTVPILYQFGDMHQTRATQLYEHNHTYGKHVRYPNVPVIQKVRMSKTPSTLFHITDDTKFQCYLKNERRASVIPLPSTTETSFRNNKRSIPYSRAHYDPIIFKLKTHRHYGGIYKVADADTIPWDSKKNLAIFRGALTGLYPDNMKAGDVEQLTVHERCRLLPRCWFTYTHGTSSLVDSKLTEPYAENKQIPHVMTMHPTQQSIDLYGDRMSMNELLEYKALIFIEGNDVSSGLKWALFSNSIVMMPAPTLTSWAMEEMLRPWVHYVPIEIYATDAAHKIQGDDTGGAKARTITKFTDAEEKMQWIIDNDDKAREIVKASTLWIADLVLHPSVANEEISIFDEMARRYLSHFV